MIFEAIESLPIARSLAQIADRPDDVADVYLERLEEVALVAEGDVRTVSSRIEQGLAVRLARDGACWLAARDGIDGDRFASALRQVARALPAARYTVPGLRVPKPHRAVPAPELAGFAREVQAALQARHVAFPLRVEVRRHRRHLQVIGTRLVPRAEREEFYSCRLTTPWGAWGTVLATLDETVARGVGASLVHGFRGSRAESPGRRKRSVVLGPAATAVLLHEAVAHALEADTLLAGGSPEAAVGVSLGGPEINVLDDPARAPRPVARATDDEGTPVSRRWLVREGTVRQPLADLGTARGSRVLEPGAGRRSGRHQPPVPRSTHLELLPGERSTSSLLEECDRGLWLPEATNGSLDPLTGVFRMALPYGRVISGAEAGDYVGRMEIRGHVTEILERVRGIGRTAESAGAGWCAKGGQKMPVWATTPAIALEGVEVGS